jgi:hypothetical protein
VCSSDLASIFADQGDLDNAADLEEQVLVTRRRVLGEEHPDTLISMSNLAYILHAKGDCSNARALYELVLVTRRRALGEVHPHTLRSMYHLARVLWQQSGYDQINQALALIQVAATEFEKVLGPQHPLSQMALATLEEWRTA